MPVTTDYNPFRKGELARIAPATQTQLAIWAACKMGGNDALRAHTNIVTLTLEGPLDADALAAAIGKAVARFDSLRADFSADGTQYFV
ncbi:MAG: hypothetical protein EBZ77_10095, partial [Chitinophagia bacterium]|nr:hypothetical protein [Chitinophagia bacterium]